MIRIKEMRLLNFRGVREQNLSFSHKVLIEGGNRKGKTTIYDAYLWCLFGQTSKQNAIIQPLDINNNIIHKLETSVAIILDIDGREIKVERKLIEEWTAKDTAEEKLKGTKTTRYIDDVPCSVKLFNEKLNALCNIENWAMLSNISLFWAKKVEDRRKILMSMAGEMDESALMQDYPAVFNGVIVEHKNISDMTIQYKSIKKKSTDDLNLIPAKIQAQDILKLDADFNALRNEKNILDDKIVSIDASLQGAIHQSTEELEYNKKHQALSEKIGSARSNWQQKQFDTLSQLNTELNAANDEKIKAENQVKNSANINQQNLAKLASFETEFNNLIQQWKDANEEKFDFTKTDICPVCGRPYTDEMKEAEYNNAVAEYNIHKSERLMEIQNRASEKKEQITALKGLTNTYATITKVKEEEALDTAKSKYNNLSMARTNEQNKRWEASEEYNALYNELVTLEANKPQVKTDTTIEEKREQKKQLTTRRDELIKLLAGEQNNARIEEQKKQLDEQAVSLAQTIADCNEVLRQINDYKKAKIEAIESKVNSYFSLVRWKFYEQNITNDDMKEICTALDKDGVNYENTNDGTVINMGVDIVNGISKAFGVNVPLFVDRKESAEDIVDTEQQTIYLQCVYAAPLNILSL
jgi:DNA repair protein SbcC/Rad50